MFSWKSWVGATALLVCVSGEAAANVGIWFGGESFRWREYDAAGARLLEESGPRFHVGADWRRAFGDDKQTLLDVRGSLYLGEVDYDGQACTLSGSCTPFQTDTEYSGVQISAIVARRFGARGGGEVFGGGGIDTWLREVKGRGSVRGVEEDWTTYYLVAGGGGYWNGPSVRVNVRVGAKYPFYTEEYPDAYDVTLEPEGRPSLFVRAQTDFLGASRPLWGLGFYYDTYRFDESDRERDGSVLIWQPESRQEVFGLYATIYLR